MNPDNTYFDKVFEYLGNPSLILEYDDKPSKKPFLSPENGIVFLDPPTYRDFTLTINGYKICGQKKFHLDQSDYKKYLESTAMPFYGELLNNISRLNTRSKILKYISDTLIELSDINGKYYEINIQFESGPILSVLSYSDINITVDTDFEKDEFYYWVIAQFLRPQREVLTDITKFVQAQYDLIGKLSYKEIRELFPQKYLHEGLLKWEKDQTDFLELVVALIKTGSISDPVKPTTRKEVIKHFGILFGREFSYSESLLSRATTRKKDFSPYLKSLTDAFDQYCQNKIDKKAGL